MLLTVFSNLHAIDTQNAQRRLTDSQGPLT
jgi:hypothetical protein